MSAAVQSAAPQPAAPPPSLDELHKAAQRRVALAMGGQPGTDYHPLALRLVDVKRGAPGSNAAVLEAELQELLTAPDDVPRRMVRQQATNTRCHSPQSEAMLRQVAAGELQRAMREANRPRVTPAELVQSFAARGVTITAGLDGNLHVTPGDRLTDADREVLRAYKPAILAVLEQPAAVI